MIDAHRIDSKLWVGGYPTDRSVCDGRFGLIVLCASEHQRLPFPCARRVHAVPLFDDNRDPVDHESKADAVRAAMVIRNARREGQRVLVTCAQGVNRSALVAALALVLDGVPPHRAIGMIKRRRKPIIDMEPLSNQRFVEFIYEFGALVRRRAA